MAFGVRAPGTIDRRVGALGRFLKWQRDHGTGHAFPVKPEVVWEYVVFLDESCSGAASASSFLEALRLGEGILGLKGVDHVCKAKHITVLAAQINNHKKEWSPAEIMSVVDVKFLQSFAEDASHHVHDRLAVIHFLFAL